MTETPKKRDDIKFIINTVAFTLTVVAILFVFQPYMVKDERIEEVKRFEGQFTYIKPDELSTLAKPVKGKPPMLVVYATWCYYCRQVMPILLQAIRDHELDGFAPVFVSMDTEPRRLSRYLVHRDYYHYFQPYVIDQGPINNFGDGMRAIGSSFTGTIPYIAFMDKDGKVKVEMNRVFTRDQLLDLIAKAK